MLVLRDPCVWRAAIWSPRWWRLAPWVSRLRLAASAGRVAMILWLMYGELFKKDHLREYCTFVRLLTVALFMVIVLRITFSEPVEDRRTSRGAVPRSPRRRAVSLDSMGAASWCRDHPFGRVLTPSRFEPSFRSSLGYRDAVISGDTHRSDGWRVQWVSDGERAAWGGGWASPAWRQMRATAAGAPARRYRPAAASAGWTWRGELDDRGGRAWCWVSRAARSVRPDGGEMTGPRRSSRVRPTSWEAGVCQACRNARHGGHSERWRVMVGSSSGVDSLSRRADMASCTASQSTGDGGFRRRRGIRSTVLTR